MAPGLMNSPAPGGEGGIGEYNSLYILPLLWLKDVVIIYRYATEEVLQEEEDLSS